MPFTLRAIPKAIMVTTANYIHIIVMINATTGISFGFCITFIIASHPTINNSALIFYAFIAKIISKLHTFLLSHHNLRIPICR